MIATYSRMSSLEAYCQEFDCSHRDGLKDLLMIFYEAAGFWNDVLETEIRSMSDKKLMEVYLNL